MLCRVFLKFVRSGRKSLVACVMAPRVQVRWEKTVVESGVVVRTVSAPSEGLVIHHAFLAFREGVTLESLARRRD